MRTMIHSDQMEPRSLSPGVMARRQAGESRVLILTADAGSGHRSAALAIQIAMQERYGPACNVKVVNPLHLPGSPGVLRFAERSYQKQITHTPELYQLQYDVTDSRFLGYVMNLGVAALLQKAIAGLLMAWPADLVVSTYPAFGLVVRAACHTQGYSIPHVTVVTDLATVHSMWFHMTDALCLAPTEAVAQKALAHGLTPEQVRVTGLPVHPRFSRLPADRRALRETLGWNPDLPCVLALGNGVNPRLVEEIAGEVANACPGAQMALVAGRNEKLRRDLERTTWPILTHVYGFTDQMPAMMHASDVLVTKAGGLTVSEGLACGLPMVIYAVVPGQESGNMAYVEERGAGVYASTPWRVGDVLAGWMRPDSEALAGYAARARAAGRADAADQVAQEVWSVLHGAVAHRNLWAGLFAMV